MDDQNRNLLLAMALSTAVLVIWFILFPPPEPSPGQQTASTGQAAATQNGSSATGAATTAAGTATGSTNASASTPSSPTQGQATAAPEAPRVDINTPALSGSLSLAGGRIDQLSLKQYHETLDPNSPEVNLLSPIGSGHAYYALFGWAPGGDLKDSDVPGPDTVWSVEKPGPLTPSNPITLRWDSPTGLIFRQMVSVDDHYMFTVTQSVENPTSAAVRLAPYASVARHHEPTNLKHFFVIHEGAMRMADGILGSYDFTYKKMRDMSAHKGWGDHANVIDVKQDGWLGFTDHYWMTMLIPEKGQPFQGAIQYLKAEDTYRTVARMDAVDVAPGATAKSTTRVFSGAKEYETIRNYEAGRTIKGFWPTLKYAMVGKEDGVPGFINAIEWGWYYFLTKPIFLALHELHGLIGNMGLAIIGLTIIIKALLFPLARKSYVSMAKMKELQPEMEKIKEKAGDDRQKLQTEMMALYKKEKVNPASGCLPIILQVPIFFSLYKVIFVTIELRHASFFGPFQDLSGPDPTSLYNLFGLLPWASPHPGSLLATIFIGILPIVLGCSMWLQQKLNPAPADPTQATIFAWMPWVFMFMLGRFPSGLVVYWITNNTITFTQQYVIMRSHGFHPDVWGNIKGKKAPTPAKKTEKKPDK